MLPVPPGRAVDVRPAHAPRAVSRPPADLDHRRHCRAAAPSRQRTIRGGGSRPHTCSGLHAYYVAAGSATVLVHYAKKKCNFQIDHVGQVDQDWVTKGAHLNMKDGMEVALRPDGRGHHRRGHPSEQGHRHPEAGGRRHRHDPVEPEAARGHDQGDEGRQGGLRVERQDHEGRPQSSVAFQQRPDRGGSALIDATEKV